jgi:hypothetical protein
MKAPRECPRFLNDSLVRLTLSGEDPQTAKIIQGEWHDDDNDTSAHGWYFLMDAEGLNLHRTEAGDLWVSEIEIELL